MRVTTTLAIVSVCLLGQACKEKDKEPTAAVDAAPSAAPASASASVAASAPASAAAPPAFTGVEAELMTVTKAWNDALASRNADGLKTVYGAKVHLYQSSLDRDAAVKAKAAALAKAKDYTQSIGPVEFDLRDKAKPKASFEKKWTQNGKTSSVRGSLGFAKEAGKWVVVDESDVATDARRAKAQQKDTCESLVVAVVASTPEAKRILNGPTNPAGGHPSNGMRLEGGPPESPQFSVALHENHDDRLVTLAWVDVDPKSGAVTMTLPDEKPLQADANAVAKMKSACAK